MQGQLDLSYAEEKFYADARQSRAGCLLVKSGEFPGQNIIIVANPKLAFAKAAEHLYEEAGSTTRLFTPPPLSNPMRSWGRGPTSAQAALSAQACGLARVAFCIPA